MNFKAGDKVRFTNVSGGGIVLRVLENKRYEIEDDHGFINIYPHSQLLPDQSKPEHFLKPIKTNKDYISKVKADKGNKVSPTLTADLHHGENKNLLSNAEIMDIQLNKFQTAINTALANKQKEVIVIHGIGNGTLKKAIHDQLKQNRLVISFAEINEGTTRIILGSR